MEGGGWLHGKMVYPSPMQVVTEIFANNQHQCANQAANYETIKNHFHGVGRMTDKSQIFQAFPTN